MMIERVSLKNDETYGEIEQDSIISHKGELCEALLRALLLSPFIGDFFSSGETIFAIDTCATYKRH